MAASGSGPQGCWAVESGSGNCASTEANAEQILMTSRYPGEQGPKIPPCKDFQTIFDLLANAGHTWRYYATSDQGFWSAPENIKHLYQSPNIVIPAPQFLTDVSAGKLADVTFVVPKAGRYSDHAGMVLNSCDGPEWVSQVVNAVGQSPFWSSTAVVLWWDDWGGWFDHVPPPASPVSPDPFEYGFRVPLIVISPYAKTGAIDHETRTFVSALRLIEETFHLPSLGTTDQYEPDGLDPMFDFNQTPIAYTPISASSCLGGDSLRSKAPLGGVPKIGTDRRRAHSM